MASTFVCDLMAETSVSSKIVDKVVACATQISASKVDVIRKNPLAIEDALAFLRSPFDGWKTAHLQNTGSSVKPVEWIIGQRVEERRGQLNTHIVPAVADLVSLREILRTILERPHVIPLITKTVQDAEQSDRLISCLSGSHWKAMKQRFPTSECCELLHLNLPLFLFTDE